MRSFPQSLSSTAVCPSSFPERGLSMVSAVSLKPEVGEPLLGLPRGEVSLACDLQKLEVSTKQGHDFSGAVANDVEAAAFLRTVESKGCDDCMAVRGDRFGQRLDVQLPIPLFRQEVQHRAVMPQFDRLCRPKVVTSLVVHFTRSERVPRRDLE